MIRGSLLFMFLCCIVSQIAFASSRTDVVIDFLTVMIVVLSIHQGCCYIRETAKTPKLRQECTHTIPKPRMIVRT